MASESVNEKVEKALETIRPYLNADGGDIELVEVTDDFRVLVKMQGTCNKCPMSMQTLKGGVEVVVKRAVPQVVEVVAV